MMEPNPHERTKLSKNGKPLTGEDFKRFVTGVAEEIATMLDLKKI